MYNIYIYIYICVCVCVCENLAKFKGSFWIHGSLAPYVVFLVIEAYILGLFKV